jgi:hypothetical protein
MRAYFAKIKRALCSASARAIWRMNRKVRENPELTALHCNDPFRLDQASTSSLCDPVHSDLQTLRSSAADDDPQACSGDQADSSTVQFPSGIFSAYRKERVRQRYPTWRPRSWCASRASNLFHQEMDQRVQQTRVPGAVSTLLRPCPATIMRLRVNRRRSGQYDSPLGP